MTVNESILVMLYQYVPFDASEWYGAAAVLGHVRMSRVDGLSLCYSE